jgi:hypothetical protein
MPAFGMVFIEKSKECVFSACFRNNKRRWPGKGKCHAKTMMSTKAKKAKMNTQHVPLRQNAEEKVRGKELKTVWDDANG